MARNGVTLACTFWTRRLAANLEFEDGHIASCLRCQAEAARYRILIRRLSALRTELVDAPPGFVPLVRSSLGEETPVAKKAPGIEAAVAAAGLAAVAGAIAFWRRSLSA